MLWHSLQFFADPCLGLVTRNFSRSKLRGAGSAYFMSRPIGHQHLHYLLHIPRSVRCANTTDGRECSLQQRRWVAFWKTRDTWHWPQRRPEASMQEISCTRSIEFAKRLREE